VVCGGKNSAGGESILGMWKYGGLYGGRYTGVDEGDMI